MYKLKLKDFEYEIKNNEMIFLKLLNNKKNKIKLLDEYIVNGNKYKITTIGRNAFSHSKIIDISLPDTITYIDHGAFMDTELKCFKIPKKVKMISNFCFEDCKKLTNVELHDNIETIGIYSFKNSCISEFICPNKITEIPFNCFENCENLSNVVLHDNIKIINNYAFTNTGLSNFIFPDNINIINEGCFCNCKNLKDVNLNNVKNICCNAFKNCVSLNGDKINLTYQNNKNIHIENYAELIEKGFDNGQANQILRGYNKFIFLNDIDVNLSVDTIRNIINKFNKDE